MIETHRCHQALQATRHKGPKLGAPKGNRIALFSLSEGESQGENQQSMLETLKMLEKKALAPKEQGEIREIPATPVLEDMPLAEETGNLGDCKMVTD